MNRRHPRDPAKAAARKAVAQRRIGRGARCRCGESRPEALIRGTRPIRCAACQRRAEGQSTIDEHHIAGRNNSPITVPVSVNDHRAELSVMQMDWTRTMRENPEGDPVIAAAAALRGVTDMIHFLIDRFVDTVIALLEALAAYLNRPLGRQWWRGTPVESFAPKR